jgi:hypothetical protein
MQPCLADPGLSQQRLPVVLIAARSIGLPLGWAKHPAALPPFGASMLTLTVLPLAVLHDQCEQLVRQGDPAAA